MRLFNLVWIIATLGLLVGCQTAVERRISDHPTLWQSLSQQDQNRLRRGFVGVGDTEAMVTIALGAPDRVQSITSPAGQQLTVWIYDWWESDSDPFLTHPSARPWPVNHEESVIFHDGVLVNRAMAGIESTPKLKEILTQRATDTMTERLDRLVKLTSAQREQARTIFAQAKWELYAFRPEERAEKGQAIRVKMRADIRALLTPAQQAKYDDAPQSLGGGSTKRA